MIPLYELVKPLRTSLGEIMQLGLVLWKQQPQPCPQCILAPGTALSEAGGKPTRAKRVSYIIRFSCQSVVTASVFVR